MCLFFLILKSVDAELKASNIELLVTSVLTDKIIMNETYTIITPSFAVTYKKIQSANIPNLENELFDLPSCPVLISNSNDCLDNNILILKVKIIFNKI